jgi:sulfatase modifying factor 1
VAILVRYAAISLFVLLAALWQPSMAAIGDDDPVGKSPQPRTTNDPKLPQGLIQSPADREAGGNASAFAGKKAGQVRDDNGLKLKLVWCPPGKYTMGSPKGETDSSWDEAQVPITLTSGFWIGRYEVTQSQWQRVMVTRPWKSKEDVIEGDDYPATYLDRDDALLFCRRLTEIERRARRLPPNCKYSLPTEAQWEYACRAGTTTRFSFGDDDSNLTKHAWFHENSWKVGERYPHKVGLKKPNPWGLYDIHGNVREWCRDGYAVDRNGHPVRVKGIDPEAPAVNANGVGRGGSYDGLPMHCRSAARGGVGPGFMDGPPVPSRFSNLGLRVVLVLSVK